MTVLARSPPRIGGEPHVFVDPNTGIMVGITHTR